MPLIPSVSVGNNASTPSTFVVTDTSSGSDVAITTRNIFIYLDDNTLFTGAAIPFPLSAGSSISLAILTEDLAYSVLMTWNDSGGGVVEQSSVIGVFTGFLEWFYYSLTQHIAAQANVLNDTNFLTQYSNLRNFIDSANQSILIGQSIYNAQSMLLLGQALETNQNLIF